MPQLTFYGRENRPSEDSQGPLAANGNGPLLSQ